MEPPQDAGPAFRIWGADNLVYGPVELPTLMDWIRAERVLADTWVFLEESESWRKASSIREVQALLKGSASPSEASPASGDISAGLAGMKPGSFRRIKVLADLDDDQIKRFLEFMEVIQVPQWAEIVKQGNHGDAMYLILEGELRVRLMIGGRESILTTLSIGEFFGEISLFDQGPRSADVVANGPATLLKIGASAFERLKNEAPDIAAPVLYAVNKTLAARIRADNKRYHDTVNLIRLTGG
jgi:hypothetical protein